MNPSCNPRRRTPHLTPWIALLAAMVLAGCAATGSRQDAPDEVIDADETAVGDEGQTVEARYLEALDLMRRNQFDDAQAAFESLVEDAPDASGPPTNLGILHLRGKRPREAKVALDQAVQVNPDNAVAWHELGRAERQLNNADAAVDAYRKAIALDDALAEAHLNLGLVLDEPLNDAEGALTHYRRYQALTGGEDLRVLVWIAELERQTAAAEAPTDETDEAPAP